MIGIIGRQLQIIKALTTKLESVGVLEAGDFSAFLAWTKSERKTTDALIDQAGTLYRSVAQEAGVDVSQARF